MVIFGKKKEKTTRVMFYYMKNGLHLSDPVTGIFYGATSF